MLAANSQFSIACDHQNNAFLYCKSKNPNPAECIKENRAVTECSYKELERIQKHCPKSFDKYTNCINRKNLEFGACRDESLLFHKCMKNI
uniref:IMS import disulfide relay-system CHCH-CHCH-like Cx9C domain-containing protein n=1 Tax=Arcella intermedia TaxID=1963864 RepID=A0A6B2LUZ1_9EUKA